MNIGPVCGRTGKCDFSVWAPFRESLALRLLSPDERTLGMVKDRMGYWSVTAQSVAPGTRYLFTLDGKADRPDPASHFQPEGVHGPSEIVYHNDFPWQDHSWQGVALRDMIIYELHVGTFTPEGTFAAIVPRLDQLSRLGVNAVEIMPVAQFPGRRNWGYDGVYLYAVQNSYGGPAGLKQLVDACHARGIAVILDVVYNHFGPEGCYIGEFGPYFTNKYTTPWGKALNFDDACSDQVRNFFVENARFWFEKYHVDALRLDAIHGIFDMGARHILADMAEAIENDSHAKGRKLYLIAESDLNDTRVIRRRPHGGHGIDAQWNDDFHHSLHTLLTGELAGYYLDFGTVDHMQKAFMEGFVYSWQYSPYRKRHHGSSAADIAADKFIVFSQNHDQVGNRRYGERLTRLVDFEGLKLAAGAVLVSPFIPLLFMGEEYGEDAPFLYFVDHADTGLLEAVREGRKKEFRLFQWGELEPPDPASPETFLKSKLHWDGRETGHHSILLEYYQELIRIRRDIPALGQTDKRNIEIDASEKQKTMLLRRWCAEGDIVCIMNFSSRTSTCTLSVPRGDWLKIMDSADTAWAGPGALLPDSIEEDCERSVPPLSIAVYVKKQSENAASASSSPVR